MSAIHHDASSDLNVVGTKLKDILEVRTCFTDNMEYKYASLFSHLYHVNCFPLVRHKDRKFW